MNKNICLLVAVLFVAFASANDSTPIVERNQISARMNMMTLVHTQWMMFFCLFGSITALFWADHGEYFDRCFTNFVKRPVFY